MGDRLLTVIIAYSGSPTPTEVDPFHPPREVVQGIRVSPIRAAGRASGFRGTALSLFLKALRSLLLFLTDSMFLISLPTNPPGDYVRKWRSLGRNKAMYHSLVPLSSLFRLQDDMKS
jgi:hypothetical protein